MGSLMGNRLKQQEATKTYEVRSGGSKYEKSVQQESRRRDQ